MTAPAAALPRGERTGERAAPARAVGRWARLRARPSALAALLLLSVVALLALFAPAVAPYDPVSRVGPLHAPPSPAHPLGTDGAYRDVLSRVIHGARVSLAVAAVATLVAAVVGTTVGAVAGYAGGRTDALLMRLVDALLALPRILVLIALFALWPGVPLPALVLLLGTTAWFPLSRLVRAQVRSARTEEYVVAARALGAGRARVLLRHVLPNVAGTVLVASTLLAGDVIIVEAGLSFLGVGVQPPRPSWGNMVHDAHGYGFAYWWMALFPGLAIALTVMAINHLGDALRDALDVRG